VIVIIKYGLYGAVLIDSSSKMFADI